VIYILKNPDFPFVLIGTADGIAELRRDLRDAGLAKVDDGGAQSRDGLPRWMKALQVMGMLAGDEFAAAALRRELWPGADAGESAAGPRPDGWPASAGREVPWREVSPRFLGWLVRATVIWDGTEVEKLGVKGLGRQPRVKPAPRVSKGVAARLARRHAESPN
jgi:hypothetical protein